MTPIQPRTDDLRIDTLRPLLPPARLVEELPVSEAASATVLRARREVADLLHGRDDRLLAVVGPCSIHDPAAARDHAARLLPLARELAGELVVVMRVYFEKPRSTLGWKGLVNDPHLDGSFDINQGLRIARRLLLDLAEQGLPAGCEFLDPISPQFLADLVSWGAIGARTSESQIHRELASGLSMPVGFKNATGGNVQVAVDAVLSSRHPHRFLGVTHDGVAAIVATRGNPDCHVILRGGSGGPNHDLASLRRTAEALEKAGLAPRVLVDCSHGNSRKEPRRQAEVARELAQHVASGRREVFGVMLESFLVEGRQELRPGAPLVYGQSITDACLSWEATQPLLRALAEAARRRRNLGA